MAKHQVTIMDIARELKISKSTVSRALANHPNVGPDTRKRVLEVAEYYEYQPNLLAKSLLQQKTYHLGVVIPDIKKPFFASIVSSIQQVAFKAGYRIIITQSNESPEEEIANIRALVLSQVDGLLVCHTRDTGDFAYMKRIHDKELPIIGFARICPDLPVPKVVENDCEGAYIMVKHLLKGGARRIGLLSGPKTLLACTLREEGYRKALQEAGIQIKNKWIVNTSFIKENIVRAVDQWMALSPSLDAIFSVYDAGAIEVIRQLKVRKKRIPDDIQVAGFGNDPIAEIIEPSLTTYAQFPSEIGMIACEKMLEVLSGAKTPPENIIVQGELIKRQSTIQL
jgi:LacI family transcriptional regulator